MDIDAGTSKFDLTLSLEERGDKLVGFFEYSTDLFHPATIERMVAISKPCWKGLLSIRINPFPCCLYYRGGKASATSRVE